MKRFISACVILAGVLSLVPPIIDAQQTPAAQRPELAILYTYIHPNSRVYGLACELGSRDTCRMPAARSGTN